MHFFCTDVYQIKDMTEKGYLMVNVEVINDVDRLDYAADMLGGVYLLLNALTEQGGEVDNRQIAVLADAIERARVSVVNVSDDLKAK